MVLINKYRKFDEFFRYRQGVIQMRTSSNLRVKDPVRLLVSRYPRLIIIKAAFALLHLGKELNYSNMESMIVNIIKKQRGD